MNAWLQLLLIFGGLLMLAVIAGAVVVLAGKSKPAKQSRPAAAQPAPATTGTTSSTDTTPADPCVGDTGCQIEHNLKRLGNHKFKKAGLASRVSSVHCLQNADENHYKCDIKVGGGPDLIYNVTVDPSGGGFIYEPSSGQ